MTTTRTSHTDCPHPSTSSARAKCRRERAQAPTLPTIDSLIASYYDGTGDLEELVGGLALLGVDTTGYYNDTLTAEEFIASVKAPTATPCPADDCTCEEANRTETIIITRGPKLKVCKATAIAHYEARLDKVDRNLAFQQNGGERTKRDTYMRILRELKG